MGWFSWGGGSGSAPDKSGEVGEKVKVEELVKEPLKAAKDFEFDARAMEQLESWSGEDGNQAPGSQAAVVYAEDAIFEMNKNCLLGVVSGAGYGVWLVKQKLVESAVEKQEAGYRYTGGDGSSKTAKATAYRAPTSQKKPSVLYPGAVRNTASPQNPVYKKAVQPSLISLMRANPKFFIAGARTQAISMGFLMASFTSIDVTLRHYRQKHDAFNKAVAGAMSGYFVGHVRGGPVNGITLGFILSMGWVFAHTSSNLTLELMRHYAPEDESVSLPDRL